MDNLFITATREAYRFESARGELSVEHLWQLPLISNRGVDLDTVARDIHLELQKVTETSFVETHKNKESPVLKAKMEVVKYIIAVKLEEQRKAAERAKKAMDRSKLLEALANKENEELSQASKEDLLKKLAALDE